MLLIFLGGNGLVAWGFAQAGLSYPQKLGATVEERDIYQLVTGNGRTALWMDYASPSILNPQDWIAIPKEARFFEVELVFTRYPLNLKGWEVNFDTLLHKRFQQLEALAPELFKGQRINWRIVLQTGCRNLQQAKECFHGFVIRYGVATRPKWQDDLSVVWKLMNGEKTLLDSTTLHVLQRHPEWKGMGIAADWTASMYANGVMMVNWMRPRLDSGRVEGLLFFNDGDSLPDSLKVTGRVGGLHPVYSLSWSNILLAMEEATMGGTGGDQRENDVEALLKVQEMWPDAEELVLVCDGKSPVRDLELITAIHKPVRIVACGSANGYVHPHYLSMAAYTCGTLHIANEDIANLDAVPEGETVQVGEFVYWHLGEHFRRIGKKADLDKMKQDGRNYLYGID